MQYKALEGPLSLWTQSAHRPQCATTPSVSRPRAITELTLEKVSGGWAGIQIVQIAEMIVNPLDLTHLRENSQLSHIGQ